MRNRLAKFFLFLVFGFMGLTLLSQEYYGSDANRIVQGTNKIWFKEGSQIPSYMAFAPGNEVQVDDIMLWLQKQFDFDQSFDLETVNEEVDYRGDFHRRVKLTYQGVPLFDGMLVLHIRDNKIYAINGDISTNISFANSTSLNESAALQLALQHVNAVRYKWQMPEEEVLLQYQFDNPNATYFPEGRLKLFRPFGQSDYSYAYVFDIYADEPLYRADVFVDAATGEILFEHNKIHETDVTGVAITKYSGTQSITTDSTATTYRLRQTGRGNGIETYNLQKGTNYGAAVDFTDSDNYWNNFNANKNEVATDAHWGTESTYDYFFYKFNRNSINNNGFKLMSYVHYGNNYVNAFWDGQRMTYGDGNGTTINPLTALDIIAHEITHGLTSQTANLVYQDEPGALNEAFSDIFGAAVEWYAKPSMANWTIGENIGTTIRSMSNPKSRGLPDTYLGINWFTGTGDNGGVHTNNGPLAYWFYLLSVGGSGTNDNSQSYSVSAISIDSAAAIAFRMLTVYLTNTSQYIDARFYAIQSAIDLFGACSQQVASTTNALYAIGVGNQYVPGVISDFSAPMTEFCSTPAVVSFDNMSNNGMTYHWDFGNGQTSTAVNPTHTYNSAGNFTVTLAVSGGSCGVDTLVKTNYISIDSQNPCVYNMPQNGTVTNTNCQGFLFDSGGNQNYHNNTNGTFIISPPGAMSVTLNFHSFSFETGYDYLYIYDGAGVTSPLIGMFDGKNLPNGGIITSSGGSITLRQVTDQYLTEPGFLLGWVCNYPTAAPVADFIVSDTLTCDGLVTLMDISSNGPATWYWDLGDGTVATTKIVNHTYQYSGLYNVKLVTSNSFGGDTIVKPGVIRVEIPYPGVVSQAVCNSGAVTLTNPDSTVITNWYLDPNSTTPFHSGHSYTTPLLTQSTVYYVEEIIEKPQHTGGKLNNSGGGAYFTSTPKHYLVFDVHKPSILHSVLMYANSNGNRVVELQNSNGTVLQSATVALTQGTNTVILDFELPAMTGLRLVGPASPNLYRNNGGLAYPYHISNLVSITHSSASTDPTGYYYYFYQWVVSEFPCVSSKIPVTVFVSNAAPVADFSFVKQDAIVNFNDLSQNPGVNTWSFGDGAFGSGANPVHKYPAVGNYLVELVVDNGCGTDAVSKSVEITSISVQEPDRIGTLRIYPNPSHGQFILELPAETAGKNRTIDLYDLMGKMVRINTSDYYDGNVIVHTNHLSSGIYLLVLRIEGKAYHARVSLL